MDAPSFDEGTLRMGNEGIHVMTKPTCKSFHNDLGNGMDEANGMKVSDLLCPSFLGSNKMLAEFNHWRFVVWRLSNW